MNVHLQDKVASDELGGNASEGPFKIRRVVRDQSIFVRSAKSRSVKASK